MTIDVNAQFDASKMDQLSAAANKGQKLAQMVADGELRDNGNGTYTATTGWDRGETFRYDTTDTSGQIIAAHGLDLQANGNAALYSRQREWFGLGEIVPDGLSSMEEILALIGGELQYTKQVAYYKDLMTGELREIPNTFAAVWMDQDGGNAPMGTVGSVYRHAQDTEAAAFLLEMIGQEVVWESVGRMNNNAKFFAGLRLAEDMVIDPSGINDGIAQYLYLINSHDGSGKLNCYVTPWRIRCGNTERFAVRDALSTWGVRHTANWNSSAKQAEASKTLGLTTAYYTQWRAEEEALLARTVTGSDTDKFWALVGDLAADGTWKFPGETPGRSLTMYRNRTDKIEERLGQNFTDLGRNLYAAERAVTQYIDHDAPRKTSKSWGGTSLTEARKGIALVGNDDDKKARLHTGLLTLAGV
jgi:phage/plasmid-like protein (TIGR03299 family)